MEVIIDYYGEDYQCLIRPDKTVNENKQEIAKLFSMEEEYISLYINDEMMEDDKKFLDYPLSYHCRIVLYYNNPNIVFKVNYKDDVSTYTIDYNRLVGDIVKLFIENNPQDCEGVDESRIIISSHGTEIDKNKSILESGITYDDEVSISIIPEEKEEPSAPEASPPSIQKLHVIAPYDDKECDIDLSSVDSVKSLFSECISSLGYDENDLLIGYTDRFIRDGMRLSDCNFSEKPLFVISVHNVPQRWQLRSVYLDGISKQSQSSTLVEGFTHHDFKILKSLIIGYYCENDLLQSLIQSITQNQMDNMTSLCIDEDSTLIETTVFSSQVAEQGLISSIRQLTIPLEKINMTDFSALLLTIKEHISHLHLQEIKIHYEDGHSVLKEQLMNTLKENSISSILYSFNNEPVDFGSLEEDSLSYDAMKVLLYETQNKLISTQNELNQALSQLKDLQTQVETLTAINAQLHEDISTMDQQPKATKKPQKSNPFDTPVVRSNPFSEVTEEGVEESIEQTVENPADATLEEPEVKEDISSEARPLVQPKMITRTSTRKRVRSSKTKQIVRVPSVIDEWTIPEDTEQYYQQSFMARSSGKNGVKNESIEEELDNVGLDEATIRDIFRLIPGSSPFKNSTEYVIMMFLADKALEGKQLPRHSLPRSLLRRITASRDDQSETEYSEYSDYSEYSNYSEYSDYSNYSDYSDYSEQSHSDSEEDDEEEDDDEVAPVIKNRNAFTKRRDIGIASRKDSVGSQASYDTTTTQDIQEPESNKTKKSIWRMPDETREKLTTEVFQEVAENPDTTTVNVIRNRFMKAGVSEEISETAIQMVLHDSETVLPIQFAVIAFLLQKQQQGIPLPKHLPLPLKSLLPVRQPEPPRNVWCLTEKKIIELKEMWGNECDKNGRMTVKTAKGIINSTCKSQPITRQIMKLITANDDFITEKQFIVGVFMAQKYCKGASISTFLPTELKEYLKNNEDSGELVKRDRSLSVSSKASRTSKTSRRNSVNMKDEIVDVPSVSTEEDWEINENDIQIPQTVLFKNISEDGETLTEKKAIEFFKSIDLNEEEIEKVVTLVTDGHLYPLDNKQFSIAFVIAQKVKRGIAIPAKLPESLRSFLV